MISKWSQSSPASTASLHALPKLARSAVRTDGAIITIIPLCLANRTHPKRIGVEAKPHSRVGAGVHR